ncbi:hypothetical protein C922_05009 [Plasmodium inui San Antonio 1]|uniref:C3H1-type domain-containing protein n=1 Tax=Plasmodium inui San Antonio 1 TaxID=1237626 RepID=W7A687_9APIC|nr:hypothetical protein C922_05009 [Plasmodium inui San Antonio 1]EUD64594.1 hypothetical protein C922_05009 [Plasmodium inui San Antonio 1]
MHRFKIYKIQMCKYALINKCDRGENCTFAHDMSELRIKPDMRKTKLCKSYILGKCTDHNCIYAHSVNELREVGKPAICQLHREGRCIKGNQCRFAHSINDINTKLVQFYEEDMQGEEMEFSHLNRCLDSVSPGQSSTLNRGGSMGSDLRSRELLHLPRQEKRREWKLSVNFNDGSSNSSSADNQHPRGNTKNGNRIDNTSKGMKRTNLIKNSSCSAFLNNNFPNLSCPKEEEAEEKKKNEDLLSARNGEYTKLCAINMNIKSTQGGVYRYDEQLLIQDDKEEYLLEGRFKKMNCPQNRQQHDGNGSIESVRHNFTPHFNLSSILSFNGEEAVEDRSRTDRDDSVNYGLVRNVHAMGEGSTLRLGNQGRGGHGAEFPQTEEFPRVQGSGKKALSSERGTFKEEKKRNQANTDKGNGLVHRADRLSVRGGLCWEGKAYPMEMLSGNGGMGRNSDRNEGRKPLQRGDYGVGTYSPELQHRGSDDHPTQTTPYERKLPLLILETNLSNELKKENGKDKDEEASHLARYYQSALTIRRDDMFDFMGGSVPRLPERSEEVANQNACSTCKTYLAVDAQRVKGRFDEENGELDGESKIGVIPRMSNKNKTLDVREGVPPNGSIPPKGREEVLEKSRLVRGADEEGDHGNEEKVKGKYEDAAMCAFAGGAACRVADCAVGRYLEGENNRLVKTLGVNTERGSIGTGGDSHKGSTSCLPELENENANGNSDHNGDNQNGVSKEGSAEGLTRYGSGLRGESHSQYGSSSTVDMCAQNLDEIFLGRVEKSGIESARRKREGIVRGLMEKPSLGNHEHKKRNHHDGVHHDAAHHKELLKYFHEMQQCSGCSVLERLRTEDGHSEGGVSDEHGEGRMDSPPGLGEYGGEKDYANFRPYNLFSLFNKNSLDLNGLPDNCDVKTASHRCVSQDEVILEPMGKGSSSSDRAGRNHLASTTSTASVSNEKRVAEPVPSKHRRSDVPVYSLAGRGNSGGNRSNGGTNIRPCSMNLPGESVIGKRFGRRGRNGVLSGNLTDDGRVDRGAGCARNADGGDSHVAAFDAVSHAHPFCKGEKKVSRRKGAKLSKTTGEEHVTPAEYDLSGGSIDECLREKHTVRSLTTLEHDTQMRKEARLAVATEREKNNNTLNRQVRCNSPVMNNYPDGSYDYLVHSNEDDIFKREHHLLYRWLGLSSLGESCPMGMDGSGENPLLTLDDEESYLLNLYTMGGIENVLWSEKDMSCCSRGSKSGRSISKRSISGRNMVHNGAQSPLKNKEEEFYDSSLGNISVAYEEMGSNNIFMGNYNWDDKEEKLVSPDEGAVRIGNKRMEMMASQASNQRMVQRKKSDVAKEGNTHFEKNDYYGDLTERKFFSRPQPSEGVEWSCSRGGEANLIGDLSWDGSKWDDPKWDQVGHEPLASVHMDDGGAGGCSNGLVGSRNGGAMSSWRSNTEKGNGSDKGRSHAEHVNQASHPNHASHALTAAFLNYDYEKEIEDDVVRSFLEEKDSAACDRLDSSFLYDFHVGNGRPFFNHGGDGTVSAKEKYSLYDDENAAAFDDGAFCVDLSKDLNLHFFSQDG